MMASLRVRLAALVLVLLGTAAPAQALLITEFLASNATSNTDEDGDFSDWLEIHNESAAAVNVGGYYLTDNAAVPTKWQLPSVSIPAGGYLLVWASSKNRTNPAAPLHTNFAISVDGEYLGLTQPDGITVEHEYAPQFPPQLTDISYGLASDLVTTRCFLTPTPAAANDESADCGFAAEVQFSVPHGFYDLPFNLTLTTPTPGATIRYTLDGSEPTDTIGTVYVSPISITTTTAVRAVAVAPDLEPSPSVTQTYIFLDAVLQQSGASLPPGYPPVWGSNASADYDMDPDVVDAPLYAATIKDDMKSIPTVSIVTDVDSLFGPQNGIYTHTLQSGDESERAASVELIFPDGSDPGFQKKCGIRIQGETARSPFNRKHSFSLRFRGNYAGDLVYPVFDTAVIKHAPVDTFREIRLFAGHQNSWHSSYGGVPARAQFLHDTYARDTLAEMGQLSSHARSVHLYLNGIYWGLYGAKERPDEDFLASYLGGTDQDYDVFKDNELENGDTVALDTLRTLASGDLTSLANYQAVLAYVDVSNLVDYMLMNFYVGNRDWSAHNWIVARRRAPGAGFLFFSWDAEITLGGIREDTLDVDGPLGIYALLLESPEFRLSFADRVHRHLFNGGVLTPTKAAERFLKRSLEIDRAVVGESARWGDRLRASDPYTRDDEWLVEKFRLLLLYFPARSRLVLNQVRGHGLYPNVVAPAFNQHGGSFFPGFQLVASAPAGTIYYTDDGTDPRLPGGAVAPSAQVYGGPLTLTNSVHIASRTLVSGQWSALNEATFVRETPVRITELMYNAPGGSDFDFVEIENVGTTAVDLGGLRFAEGIDFTFPSMSLAAGAHVLAVKNQAAFDSLYGAGKPIAGVYGGNLANSGERLLLEDAQGDPIHDFEFLDAGYPTTDGGGYSLVIRDAHADKAAWGLASGWRASTFVNGSAAAAEAPFCGDGVDNDGDAAVDLADPGCGSATQDLENPECNDGLDNDGDGATDLADAECGSAAEDAEAVAPVDSSLCYKVQTSPGSPFLSVAVTLSDEFDADVSFLALSPQSLCLPGALNQATVLDDATHLESYKIREVPGEPRHVPQPGLHVESQFGPMFIATSKPDRLLVPTSRDAPGPPDPAQHDVDAYKCYSIKLTAGAPRYFPQSAQANFKDAFEHREYTLRRPKRFCTPVAVNGAAIKNPAGYLLCYPAKKTNLDPTHVRRLGIQTANALGSEVLDTRREEELCLPARLVP